MLDSPRCRVHRYGIPECDPNPASKERFVKLRQKMSAGNRGVVFVPLEASFLWARVLVKKWTRSAVAPRARGPCPAATRQAVPRTLGGGTTRRDHGASGPHQPPPAPKPTPGRQQSPDAWPGRRFLRKQRDRGSPGASICASRVVRYRDCRLCCTQNSRGTRKERGRDQHRATVL